MIEIEEVKPQKVKTKYGELKPGDVFNFGADNAAIGIKTLPGHVLVESCYGIYSFEHIGTIAEDVSVIFRGRLVKLGVTNKCKNSD